MSWFRFDSTFSTHPAARAAGLKGRALWIEAAQWSTQHLTDGRIDKHMLPLLAASAEIGTGRPEANKLVTVGLWTDEGDHWQILNWSTYQPPRADVEAVKAKRGQAGAEGNHKRWHVKRGITVADCEWCHPKPVANESQSAIEVGSQTDRHSTAQHDTDTYDHHQPTVVATRPEVVGEAIRIIAEREVDEAIDRGTSVERRPAFTAAVRRRLTSELTGPLTALAHANPDATPARLVELHHGAGQPLLPANAPPPPSVHADCPPPCDGHGNHIHDDGVTPNACPGTQPATQGANQQ